MYIEIKGGLTARLYVLASILSSDYASYVNLVWDLEDGMTAYFHELFDNKITFFKKADLEILPEKHNPALGIHIENDMNKFVYTDWPIRFDGESPDLDKMYEWLKQLRPNEEIQSLIDRYEIPENTIGWQIRRGVGINYNMGSCIFSPTRFVFDFVQKVIEENPNQKFYFATDSCYALERACIRFLDNLIYIKEYRDYPIDGGYSLNGMKRAVADFFLLSKCDHLYSTEGSGFARRIAEIYNKPIKVISLVGDVEMKYKNKQLRFKQQGQFTC